MKTKFAITGSENHIDNYYIKNGPNYWHLLECVHFFTLVIKLSKSCIVFHNSWNKNGCCYVLLGFILYEFVRKNNNNNEMTAVSVYILLLNS